MLSSSSAVSVSVSVSVLLLVLVSLPFALAAADERGQQPREEVKPTGRTRVKDFFWLAFTVSFYSSPPPHPPHPPVDVGSLLLGLGRPPHGSPAGGGAQGRLGDVPGAHHARLQEGGGAGTEAHSFIEALRYHRGNFATFFCYIGHLNFFVFASRGALRNHSPSAPTSPFSGKPLPFLDFRRGMGMD